MPMIDKKLIAREYLIISGLFPVAYIGALLIDLVSPFALPFPKSILILFAVLVWLRYALLAARTLRNRSAKS